MTYLRYGHAPGDLRDAFAETIELDLQEVELRGEKISLRRLCGLLWNCTDTLPQQIADNLDEPRLGTYAAAARALMASLRRRARSINVL